MHAVLDAAHANCLWRKAKAKVFHTSSPQIGIDQVK